MVSFQPRLFTIILLIVVAPHIQAVCYYPNGDANDDIPCNSTAEFSVCCTRGWTCLTNGVCQNENDPSGVIWARLSCTDKTFNSPQCPRFCQAVNLGGGAKVYSCSSTEWCCDIGLVKNGCCSDPANLLDLGPQEVQTTVGIRPPAESSSGAGASGSMAPEPSSLSSITQTSTTSPSTTGAPSATRSGGASQMTSQPTAAPHPPRHLSAAIGAGVGGPLGAGIAALLYLWIRQRRQRKRVEEEVHRREKAGRWENEVAEHRRAVANEPQEMDTRIKTQAYSKPELSDDARREIFEVAGHGEQHS